MPAIITGSARGKLCHAHALGRLQHIGADAFEAGICIFQYGQQRIEHHNKDGGQTAYAQQGYEEAEEGQAGHRLHHIGHPYHRLVQMLDAGYQQPQRHAYRHGAGHSQQRQLHMPHQSLDYLVLAVYHIFKEIHAAALLMRR